MSAAGLAAKRDASQRSGGGVRAEKLEEWEASFQEWQRDLNSITAGSYRKGI